MISGARHDMGTPEETQARLQDAADFYRDNLKGYTILGCGAFFNQADGRVVVFIDFEKPNVEALRRLFIPMTDNGLIHVLTDRTIKRLEARG